MVIDATGVGHGLERSAETLCQFGDGQVRVPSERAGGRVHGHVQDHDLAGLVSFTGKFGGVRGVGHHRGRHRARKGQYPAIAGQVLPQIVDDQAQVSLGVGVRMIDRRRMGGTGQAAE